MAAQDIYQTVVLSVPFLAILTYYAFRIHEPYPPFVTNLFRENIVRFVAYLMTYVIGNMNIVVGLLYGITVFSIDNELNVFSDKIAA